MKVMKNKLSPKNVDNVEENRISYNQGETRLFWLIVSVTMTTLTSSHIDIFIALGEDAIKKENPSLSSLSTK